MIHGRFQPFHNGHLEYMRLALERCDTLIIGITNPDPGQIREEATSDHRHLDESNPFTFFERHMMIRSVIRDEGIPPERVVIAPFPINLPERWRHYVPSGVTQYIRIFSDWEQTKADRFIQHGFPVEVLTPGVEKEIEATEVRRRIAAGGDWESLVPRGVARVISDLRKTPRPA